MNNIIFEKLKISKITGKKEILKAVTITLILIVAAFVVNSINPYNAYYIKPIEYCIGIDFIALLLKRQENKWTILFKSIALYNAVTLTYLELEMWQGNNLALPFDGVEMMHIRLVINWILILGVILITSGVFGTLKRGIVISAIAFCILGIASFIVVEFRGEVLLPTDIAALRTAVNVAGTYHIQFKSNVFAALLCFFTILVWTRLLPSKMNEDKQKKRAKRLIYCLLSLLIFWTFDMYPVENFYYPWFVPNNGYTFAIATNIKLLNIKPESNYSVEEVRETILGAKNNTIVEDYNAKEAIEKAFPDYEGSPNIICIMNESFTTFSQFSEFLKVDREIAPFINSIKDKTIQGDLIVEVFGGGTSDTEFAFFTGLSTKLFPTNARAYELYINEKVPNLVSNLKEQEYTTIALHADKGENWNRDNVYPLLGFDEFYTIEDFEDSEIVRDIFVSDRATYQRIEEIYETKGDNPLFVFDLTIQNHGSYDQSYENLEQVNLESPENYPKTEQFLSLINESDRAFEELVKYFENVDEPTIICMFGDHLPKLESDLYTSIFNTESSETLEEQRLLYTTPFIIWANYDLPKDEIEEISINYLSTFLVELSGTEKTAFNSYLANLYNSYPVIDKNGILNNNNENIFYNELDEASNEKIKEYNNIIYNLLFDSDKSNADLYEVE